MTITVPWRRMTLQLSQRALTEARTFNGSSFALDATAGTVAGALQSVGDPTSGEVVRRELHPDAVAGQDADEVHPELAADVGQDAMAVLQLDREHRVGQRLDDRTLDFDRVFLGHRRPGSPSRTQCRPGRADTRTVRISNDGRSGNSWWVAGLDGGEDLRATLGDRDGVLEVGGQAAVLGDDRPIVVEDPGVVAAEGQHRLDGQA